MSERLHDTKLQFNTAMKALKAFVAANKWCCLKHELVAQVEVTVFSTLKNAALRDFKAGEMPEEEFISFIDEGTKRVVAKLVELKAEQADKAVVNSINMPCPAEAS